MMMKAKRHTFFPPALTLMVLCSVPAFSARAGLDFSAGANDIGYGANVSGAVSDKLYYNLAAARCYPSRRGAVICNVWG